MKDSFLLVAFTLALVALVVILMTTVVAWKGLVAVVGIILLFALFRMRKRDILEALRILSAIVKNLVC